MNKIQEVAHALIAINAVGFSLQSPITFKSGIVSPVYVDNRILPSNPTQWQTVIYGFGQLITELKLRFDIIAGIETAGIPHSSALGFFLHKPSVFIRKAAKDHGTKKLIEGGDVTGKRVLLIEDHISTGSSSLHGVRALREAGATVVACLSITSYEFAEASSAFVSENVPLYTLTTFEAILQEAQVQQKLNLGEIDSIRSWLRDPHTWGEKYDK